MDNKKCLVCGDVFYKKQNESRRYWKTKKYCSPKCSLTETSVLKMYGNFWKGKHLTKEVKEKLSEKMKGRPGNKGSFKKGHPSNLGRKFPTLTGSKNPRWENRTKKSCLQCKKIMLLAPWEVRKDKKLCSRECWALYTRGTKNPVFKGDKAVSIFRKRVMQLPEYQTWRMDILKRDDFTCQICEYRKVGKKRIPLEVDHIKRFYFIVKENNLTTMEDARNCRELWNTKNGQTVCRPCHRTLDTYGTTGLTKSYYQTF